MSNKMIESEARNVGEGRVSRQSGTTSRPKEQGPGVPIFSNLYTPVWSIYDRTVSFDL